MLHPPSEAIERSGSDGAPQGSADSRGSRSFLEASLDPLRESRFKTSVGIRCLNSVWTPPHTRTLRTSGAPGGRWVVRSVVGVCIGGNARAIGRGPAGGAVGIAERCARIGQLEVLVAAPSERIEGSGSEGAPRTCGVVRSVVRVRVRCRAAPGAGRPAGGAVELAQYCTHSSQASLRCLE